MKWARDYRESGWNILRGRYWWAVLAGLIASILGGFGSGGSFRFEFNYNADSSDLYHFAQRLFNGQFDLSQLNDIMRPFSGIAAALGGLIAAYGIAMFIIGSAVELGYDKFNLTMFEIPAAPKIETIFSRFSYFGNALLLRLLMFVKILLWTLLFIIPGIVASYRYALAPYLMAENPDIGVMEAIARTQYGVENADAVLTAAGKPQLKFYDESNAKKYLIPFSTAYRITFVNRWNNNNNNLSPF